MRNICLSLTVLFTLSACNLFGGISKPNNDPQYLLAARSCLDHGDYNCAQSNYAALSSNYNDVKISESSLTTLAQKNIFSFADLIGSLGSGTGNGASFTILANLLAARGKTDAATRALIQQLYLNENAITDSRLKSFSQFIAAFNEFNAVIATAVGPSGVMQVTDLVTSAVCKSDPVGGCLADANCDAPAGTALLFTPGDTTVFTAATGWNGLPTFQKAIAAATEATNNLAGFTGQTNNYSGLLATIQALSGAGGSAADRCTRQAFAQILFP